MLPATNPEPQKIAKPTTTAITRPRRPILGILDGLGRSKGRGLLSSPVLSLMLGFQYAIQPARKGNRGYVGIRFRSRLSIFSRTCNTFTVPSGSATSLSSSNSRLFRDLLRDLRIQSAAIGNMGLGK